MDIFWKHTLNNHNLGKQTASLPKANKKPKLLRISSRTLEAFFGQKKKNQQQLQQHSPNPRTFRFFSIFTIHTGVFNSLQPDP